MSSAAFGVSFIPVGMTYTLVNVPVVITLFFPIHRMKEHFMELLLVSRKGKNFKVI